MPVFKMIDRCAIVARVRDEVALDVAEHKHSPGLATVQDHHVRLPADGCDGDVVGLKTPKEERWSIAANR
jgi:hypothetical protein